MGKKARKPTDISGIAQKITNKRSLTDFQKAVLTLERQAGVELSILRLSQYLAERDGMNEDTVRKWIKAGTGQFTPSALEIILEDTKLINSMRGQELLGRISQRYIPITEYPDLENCISILRFQCPMALFRAISEETGIPYFAIRYHARKSAKYGRREIKACLDEWLRKERAGEPLGINPKYLIVTMREVHLLVNTIVKSGRYKTKKELAYDIWDAVGLKPVTLIDKYFPQRHAHKQARFKVYEHLKGMFRPYNPREKYKPGELVFSPLKEDFGFVASVNGRTMSVEWERIGRLTMAQNDPY